MRSAMLPQAAAAKMLFKELAKLRKEPVEGFRIIEVDESDVYEWTVAIFGPPGTVYEGGCFKAVIKFGCEYPFQPPTFRFLTKIWHPNIYENGEVCISILHPSTNQAQGGELPEERWNPTQGVRTVIMSIISLLNEPNTFSPANVDASVMYRDFKAGKSDKYTEFCARCVSQSQMDARRSAIPIPASTEDYINIGTLEYRPSDMSIDTIDGESELIIHTPEAVSRRNSNESWDFEVGSDDGSTNDASTQPRSTRSNTSLSEGDASTRGSNPALSRRSSIATSTVSSGDAFPNQQPQQIPLLEDEAMIEDDSISS